MRHGAKLHRLLVSEAVIAPCLPRACIFRDIEIGEHVGDSPVRTPASPPEECGECVLVLRQGVPGPAIALSPRNPLGGSVDADELDLGALDSNSGAQAFALPGAPDEYGFVWIWCKPFGLDVAYAQMEFQ